MNSYFELTETPGRRRPPLSQKRVLHQKLTVLGFQLAKQDTFRYIQRLFCQRMFLSMLVNPVAESTIMNTQLASDVSDRT
jgi:hypothetical protein